VLLSQLDSLGLFSLTLWRSEGGYCVGVQQFAGDQVRYETRRTAAEAIAAALGALASLPCVEAGVLPAPPY